VLSRQHDERVMKHFAKLLSRMLGCISAIIPEKLDVHHGLVKLNVDLWDYVISSKVHTTLESCSGWN
jgi:hypothetical protein